jgi:acid phosphatase
MLLLAVAVCGGSMAGVAREKIPIAEPTSIPNLQSVKDQIETYHDSGAYVKDIARVDQEAADYLSATAGSQPKPAMVFDIDETTLTNWQTMKDTDFGWVEPIWNEWVKKAQAPAIEPSLALFRTAREKGVTCFFVTGRRSDQRAETEQNLQAVGYVGYQGVFCRPLDDKRPSMASYKTDCRRRLWEQGWHIVANIGDQFSDLEGGYADRTFKLPNPMYFVP